jgi:hypothetical protein
MKSGYLNFLEASGPIQVCNGTALPLLVPMNAGSLLAGLHIKQRNGTKTAISDTVIIIIDMTNYCGALFLLQSE